MRCERKLKIVCAFSRSFIFWGKICCQNGNSSKWNELGWIDGEVEDSCYSYASKNISDIDSDGANVNFDTVALLLLASIDKFYDEKCIFPIRNCVQYCGNHHHRYHKHRRSWGLHRALPQKWNCVFLIQCRSRGGLRSRAPSTTTTQLRLSVKFLM